MSLGARLVLLFGGFFNLFGWFFFGFGSIFFWIFGGSDAVYNMAFFSGELLTTEARITQVLKTSLTINEQRVYAFHYDYVVDDREFHGETDGYYRDYREGDRTTVEYAVSDVSRSRIKGLDTGLTGWPLLAVSIFPVVGLGFIFFGFRKGAKGVRLLLHGRETVGEYRSREATSTRVNNRTVYKYLFAFNDEQGKAYIAEGRSHLDDVFDGEDVPLSIRKGRSGPLEPLVYNPDDPSDSVLLDDLPASPRIQPDGRIAAAGIFSRFSLFLPAVAIFGNLLWILHLLEVL